MLSALAMQVLAQGNDDQGVHAALVSLGLGFDLGPQAVRQTDNELVHVPASAGRQFGYIGCSFHGIYSGAIAGAWARGYLLMPMKGSGEPLAM